MATKWLNIFVTERFDVRPIDFDSGKRLAISREAMRECQCCGTRIVKVSRLNTGHEIGSECATIIEHINAPGTLAVFGLNKRQHAFVEMLRAS